MKTLVMKGCGHKNVGYESIPGENCWGIPGYTIGWGKFTDG